VSLMAVMAWAREKFFAVADAEEEDESVEVGAEGVDAVGGVADIGGQAASESLLPAAGEPAGDEGERLGKLDGVADVEGDLGHGDLAMAASPRGGRAGAASRPAGCRVACSSGV
jgi:hypothetical protein